MNVRNLRLRLATPAAQRGSALLVSLMVMVGLSLLGLGFVAISETESAISTNERNYAQALNVAETGARSVVEMFQSADWASDLGILPPNSNTLKTERTVATYTGYYKTSPISKLFDSPFKPSQNDRFFGDYDNADIIINASKGTIATDYLDDLNTMLFGANSDTRITDLRVFAPPIVGGTLTGGFWVGGDRFGVATVAATAEKRAVWPSGRPLARRTVKIVIGETPLPGATGPIQTEGAITSAGNFHVFWGKITSVENLKVARPAVGMPWFDAKEHIWYEYGYDSTLPWTINTNYNMDDLVHAPQTAWDANPELRKYAYEAKTNGNSGATEPLVTDWPEVVGQTFDHSGITWETVVGKQFPVTPAEAYSRYEWLHEMAGRTLEDPWFHARSRQELVYGNANQATPNAPHPYKYNNPALNEQTLYSNFFKYQTKTEPTDYVEVTFPAIDYEFWKEIAQSSEPDSGIIYLRWNAATQRFVSVDNVSNTGVAWLNALNNDGYDAGFYFFDTANGLNPQFGGGGTLTPAISIDASVASPWQMQGFIYLNAQTFGSTGQGGIVPDDVYPMPGEPFRDVGFREVDDATWQFVMVAGDYKISGRDNGVWDFQDLNDNFQFDLVVEQRTITRPGDGSTATVWLPKPYYPGCSNFTADCSEPHEPYLNFLYPAVADPEGAITVGWQDPNTQTRRPKTRTGQNAYSTCTSSSGLACTSNMYDEQGALVTLAPLLNGILYNEGGYAGQGNAWYYGSLLIRQSVDVTGTPKVFFNECILRGCWQEMLNLPKVRVQSMQTDQ
ncbi:MAG TPA: hypothetical protein VMS56_00815 [Thermoanaerobaculia bacterium]|nr:hypothetical protein [Thermoanaerobaculia bacterium]